MRQTACAKLCARTVGESLCMSKSVGAHYKGQIVSARDLPTGCQQQCSLVVPTVRAPRAAGLACHEPAVTLAASQDVVMDVGDLAKLGD